VSDNPSAAVRKVAPQTVHDVAPALAWYTDHVLFHRIWNRPNLSKKDRSIVTVSALTSSGNFAQLDSHWSLAVDHGFVESEISELITHLAFQAGWPNAMTALRYAHDVLKKRGIGLQNNLEQCCVFPDMDGILPDPVQAMQQPFRANPFSAALAEGLENLVERDVWARPALNMRDRSISTISTLISSGNIDQLMTEVRRGIENGLTISELCEIVLHIGYYVGLPKARNAAEKLDPLGSLLRM
jgi:4-carboxymuconolactone decarboxylase